MKRHALARRQLLPARHRAIRRAEVSEDDLPVRRGFCRAVHAADAMGVLGVDDGTVLRVTPDDDARGNGERHALQCAADARQRDAGF